jgi:hypothetical protein
MDPHGMGWLCFHAITLPKRSQTTKKSPFGGSINQSPRPLLPSPSRTRQPLAIPLDYRSLQAD